MAKQIWNNSIDKHTDWGGDSSTNNYPVSGEKVLEFIKNSLDSKIGELYYDTLNNRYLVFSDSENRDIYLNDPVSNSKLLLGTFDAPFNYSAEITMFTPSYSAVFLGSTGNYIDFSFDIKNKQGSSTGESVTVTYTFIHNATKKIVTETRKYGETVHLNVDEYLLEGSNTIIVGITGLTTLAATTVALLYNVINLVLTDEINISKVYDISKGQSILEAFFNISGSGTKIVEWYLDGELLPFVKTEDEIIDVSSSRTKYISLSNLSEGIHNVLVRAYTLVNGEKFYTDTLYREILIKNLGNINNAVVIATNVPLSYGIIKEDNPIAIFGTEQYIPTEIRFATLKTADIFIYLDNELLTSLLSFAGVESTYSIVSSKSGAINIKFKIDEIEREIPTVILPTTLNIEEITSALSLDFSARGKSNSAIDKDSWLYNDYIGIFNGFHWNAASGWVDNSLIINTGASFDINIAPLAIDATNSGKTLEFEFSTRNVEDDDAIVCDLTDENGAGILITASEARLVSASGEVVNTRFRSGEMNRISFVINRKTGTTYKGLAFIYINGILSGAVNYGSADNFISTKTLSFQGSESAQVELRSLRFYDTALSHENILNNYILYQNTLNDMMNIYYRNDIYEDGTVSFSPDKALHRLPVMIVTGDIQTLEGATSTSTLITVDIDYINELDPSKSFKMKDAAMRIQGTSSLAYPRKNFRIYTKKVGSTIVYDANGNVVKNKLYSFKDKAQPVDCWCLKADFAESSGTHNTSIAKIWNNVMVNAKVQYKNILGTEVDGYVLRTKAQESALNAGYEYDVRTTIDGFPILLFYKKNANDTNLIFLGKYNFNNDKSTPSVFGFENIPNFNNTKMQCWETKDNGNPLGLFTDISSFDDNWDEAFESRYPDTKTPNTSDLKSFSLWINEVSQEDISTDKWNHLDVYKVAAYYVYLMRFGAVDQTVKNAFLTSEDGQHFFFINYDNDTINGLINTGKLTLDPYINRQTIGTDGEYVYAGHSSVLWNKLEADTEFMDIVSVVDNALFSAGLRYENIISMFNDEQASKWVERVYNQDAEYKYILPYVNSATNNLFMLLGSRSSHRAWWLSKRFALYDSLFASGNYRDRNISFKCLNDTLPGQSFTIEAGTGMNYGYGVNNGIRETGISLEPNDLHTFTTTDTLNLGDVVKIFAASNIKSLDLSSMAPRLAVLDCSAANDPALGSKLKNLTLGNTTSVNTELSSISGIGVLNSLQNLNIEGYKNITSLDLSKLSDLRKLYAKRSALSSVDFVPGAPVEYIEFPLAMHSLNLNQLPLLSAENLILEGGLSKIHSMTIHGCPLISSNYNFIKQWLVEKPSGDASSVLDVDNIKWENMDINEFISFSLYKTDGVPMILKGNVYIPDASLELIELIQTIWGDDCFSKNADLRIHLPVKVYISPNKVTINDGESILFNYALFGSDDDGSVEYRVIGDREGVTIDKTTGLLTTVENGLSDGTVYVRIIYTLLSGDIIYDTSTVTIKKRIYPTSSSVKLNGVSIIGQSETFTWTSTTANINGVMDADWQLSGNAFTLGYIEIESHDSNSCLIKLIKAADEGVTVNGTLTLNLRKKFNNELITTKTFNFRIANYVYPNLDNTIINGLTIPENTNTSYVWESSVEEPLGDFTVNWSISDLLIPYFLITEQTYNADNPRTGNCVILLIAPVEFYVKGTIDVTFTYTSTNKQVIISKLIYQLNVDVIMTEDTNPEVLKCFYNAGLCASPLYMSKSEAEAVVNGLLNPSGSSSGSIFYSNRNNITNFDEFQYFTGLTLVDAYAFYQCKNLEYIKIPNNIRIFKTSCFDLYGISRTKPLNIDTINIEDIYENAFRSKYISSPNYSETWYNNIVINNINLYDTENQLKAFHGTTINEITVHNSINNYTFTSSNTLFLYCDINNIKFAEDVINILDYLFYNGRHYYNIYLHKNIKSIGYQALYINNYYTNNCVIHILDGCKLTNIKVNGFGINRLIDGILDLSDFDFTTISDLPNMTIGTNIIFDTISLENNTCSKINYQHIIRKSSIKKLILPSHIHSTFLQISYSNDVVIEDIYIPNISNYCQNSYSTTYSLLAVSKNIFIKNDINGFYEKANDLDTNKYLISIINNYTFALSNNFKTIDLSFVKDIKLYAFKLSVIEELILDNNDGTTSIAQFAFENALINTITDTSYSLWNNMNSTAFININENVSINSNQFGLFKHNLKNSLLFKHLNGSTNSFDLKKITALPLTEVEFTSPYGTYFDLNQNKKIIRLTKTGSIEDLTNQLLFKYSTVNIQSNMSDALFKIQYTNVLTGESIEKDLIVGQNLIENADFSKSYIISAVTNYDGYVQPVNITSTMQYNISINMNYVMDVDYKIQHLNGELYSVEQWTENNFTKNDANGIAILSKDYNVVVDIHDMPLKQFGGKYYEIRNSNETNSKEQTHSIINLLSNATYSGVLGAPAAEFAVNSSFKNGIYGLGYLPTRFLAEAVLGISSDNPLYPKYKNVLDCLNVIINDASTPIWTCTAYSSSNMYTYSYALQTQDKNYLVKTVKMMDILLPVECLSLNITGDNIKGYQTQSLIHYEGTIKAKNYITDEIIEVPIVGDAYSEELSINETAEPILRQISFTYLNYTATTTIILDVIPSQYYIINLNDQWLLSSNIANPDVAVYDGVYLSFSNKSIDNSLSKMYITIVGYTNFKLYIRSYSASGDYVMVSHLDEPLPDTPTTSNIKAHTSGRSTNNTAISSYLLVEYTNLDGGEHTIEVGYRKDGSGSGGYDEGYVLIPKEQ